MEIIRKKNQSHSFRVLKSFRWAGYLTEPGQILQMADGPAIAQIIRGRLEPEDFPDPLEAIVLCDDLIQPGNEQAFKAKKFDRVLLKKEQAISLMLERRCIPASDEIWRPWGLRLKRPDEDLKTKLREAGLDKARWEASHPGLKRK